MIEGQDCFLIAAQDEPIWLLERLIDPSHARPAKRQRTHRKSDWPIVALAPILEGADGVSAASLGRSPLPAPAG